VKRKFRLTRSTDFKRVRRLGKSYAHPLIVLIALPNELEQTRFGVVAGRAVGGAVQRNRAKRLMRAALQPYANAALLPPGWDLMFIARAPFRAATYQQTQAVLLELFRRSRLLQEIDDH
jgi:ribonuclease P protein component